MENELDFCKSWYSYDKDQSAQCCGCGKYQKDHYDQNKVNNSNNLSDVFFDEDYGFGEVVINNTKIDQNVFCKIRPFDFEDSNKVIDLINTFARELSKLKLNKHL